MLMKLRPGHALSSEDKTMSLIYIFKVSRLFCLIQMRASYGPYDGFMVQFRSVGLEVFLELFTHAAVLSSV